MRTKGIITVIAAASVALAPVAATAADAPPVPQRASAQLQDPNALSGENTPVFIGLILIILFGLVVILDNRDRPNNPVSP